MIKITYDTTGGGLRKDEKTTIQIFNNRMFVRYNINGKAEQVVNQMKKDGRKNVLYSRGCMIQIFNGKTEDEILEIAKEDIKNGLYVAEQKTGKKFEIKDMEIKKI